MHVFYSQPDLLPQAKEISTRLKCSLSTQIDASAEINLRVDSLGLTLLCQSNSGLLEMRLDFQNPRLQQRVHQKNQALFKACNNKQKTIKTLLDLTAGWGSDSYLLASKGQMVTMLECNPMVHLLLQTALESAQKNDDEIAQRISLQNTNSLHYLQTHAEPVDCIYLDPMFPTHKSSAKAKKPLQFLQSLTHNTDLEQAFELSLQKAVNRVVVKRPIHAPTLTQHIPDIVYPEKTIRFDVYLNKTRDLS